jgi:AcrR family transcriptional regulator
MLTFRALTVKTEPFSLGQKMSEVVENTGQRGSSKQRTVLAGARALFREVGFERASVDAIAARAGVSKATVYSHFRDKAALFVACFAEESAALRAEYLACLREPTGSLEDALRKLGEKLLAVFVSPAALALYRHTCAEVGRFPEMGQMIFERGPAIAYEKIGAYLAKWAERGALRIDDPRAAAVHFVLLCQGELCLRAQLGVLGDGVEAQIRETVRRGVAVFVAAYGA